MTTLTPSTLGSTIDPNRPRRPTWSRRRKLTVVGVLIAVIGAAVGTLTYAHNYQPIVDRTVTIDSIGAAESVSDGFSEQTGVVLTGGTGSRGGEVVSLENDGHFSVTLLPSPSGDGPKYSWLPVSEFGANRAKMLSETRPLPVALKPHSFIYIFMLETKPDCHRATGLFFSDPEIRTESFGFHHWYKFPIGDDGPSPIYACPTKQQLGQAITR